jgi:FkbM family methyltransferase
MNQFHSIREINAVTRKEFEQTCITYTDHAYMGDYIQLCRILSKYKMYIDGRDAGIAPHLIMDGYWESWITRFIAGIVKPGATCLDIGANFGYYAQMLAELAGKEGRAIAIEPNPSLCHLLRLNAAVNPWHFEVEEGAAADRKGETTLTVQDNFFGGATIMPLDDSLPGRKRFTVNTFTIDDLLDQKQIKKLDFIKMDCEGFEPFVLEGMERTLQNSPDLEMVMEYSAYMYTDPETYTKRLFDAFDVFHITVTSTLDKLSSKDIGQLIKEKEPYDLFLKNKPRSSFFSFLKG